MVEALRLAVEDVFRIERRGDILAPHVEPGRLPLNCHLAILVVHANGQSEEVQGRFSVEHFRLLDGGSSTHGVITIDIAHAGVVVPGDTIVAREVK